MSLLLVVGHFLTPWILVRECLVQYGISPLALAPDPALVGSEQRMVWLHPSANGDLKCMSDDSAPNRFARWYEVRSKGLSEQLRALYPTLGPRKYPRGPRQQIGDQEARARLLGGACGGAGAIALVVVAVSQPVASSSAACAVAAGDADGGPPLGSALPTQAGASSSGTSAHAVAASTTAMPVHAPLPPPAKALPPSLPLAPLDLSTSTIRRQGLAGVASSWRCGMAKYTSIGGADGGC